MSDPADIQRLVGDVIRLGTIASVDPANATCTVCAGAIVSPELPWLAFRAGGTRFWSPPTVGEQCLMLCPEGDTAAGVVLLGLYSDANPAPDTAAGLDLVEYGDGARIGYDAVAHALTAILPAGGTVALTAPGGVTITGPLTVEGEVTIKGKATASEDVVGGGISLKSHRHGGVQSGSARTGAPA